MSLGTATARLLAVAALGLALSFVPARAGTIDAWGGRIGWTSSHFTGSFGDAFPDSRNDVSGSLFSRFRLNRLLSLQPEMGWAPRGGGVVVRTTVASGPSLDTFEVRANHQIRYLEMPLLLRLEAPVRGAIVPYAVAGPALAFRMGSAPTRVSYSVTQVASSMSSVHAPRPYAQIFEDVGTLTQAFDAKPMDASAIGGLGVWFARGPVKWGLEGRYAYGLLNVRDATGLTTHNAAFALSTAVEFR